MNTVALVHSHHLLDHKPDNLLLKGGKYKLRGIACLGRPGVALCIGPSVAIDNFRMSMEDAMPQKKFGTIILSDVRDEDALESLQGFVPASLGDLRAVLASLGYEDHFFTLTGLDPNVASTEKGKKEKGKKK